MKDQYVKKSEILQILSKYYINIGPVQERMLRRIKEDVFNLQASDVEPVRHGRWKVSAVGIATCSLCGHERGLSYDRCIGCNAKMDGGVSSG